MSEQQNQVDEIAGMGVRSPTSIKAPVEQVWAAMVDKMYNPEKYLPVTNPEITIIIPEHHIYREMYYKGNIIKENVYFDQSNYEIHSAAVDKDHVHVNIYHPDTGILEYWQEDSKGERIEWQVPRAVVLGAMEMIKKTAEAGM